MNQLGIGAILHTLGGGSPKNPDYFYGRKIVEATMIDEILRLTFADNTAARIWDNGQSCCEHRYMTCDDDLSKLVGGTLTRVETKPGPDTEHEYNEHQQMFIEIGTDECFVTVCTHNVHNGYYGGFGLCMDED